MTPGRSIKAGLSGWGAAGIAAVLAVAMPSCRAAEAQTDLAWVAQASGTPDIPGLHVVWLHPWSGPHPWRWRNVIVHQTEGPSGSARNGALAQARDPVRRGVMVWVETDGTVYWATSEDVVPTHGDGANRNDSRFIDNRATFHQVVKENSIGVEFAGNYPDVAAPPTAAQIAAWDVLAAVLRTRYGIPRDRIYAHNWIDFKDARYCEGCELAQRARRLDGGRP